MIEKKDNLYSNIAQKLQKRTNGLSCYFCKQAGFTNPVSLFNPKRIISLTCCSEHFFIRRSKDWWFLLYDIYYPLNILPNKVSITCSLCNELVPMSVPMDSLPVNDMLLLLPTSKRKQSIYHKKCFDRVYNQTIIEKIKAISIMLV